MTRWLRHAVVLGLVLLLASCWRDPHGYYAEGSTELSRERFAQIVDALNERDASAVKEVFSEYALAESSTEIDEGVDYLLTLFPDGDITWDTEQGLPSVQYRRVDDDHRTILARSMYRVSSGGKDYWLFFADFTTNTIDPDNVGIFALGVSPRTEASDSDEEEAFFEWTDPFDAVPRSSPGIYIPE